MIFKMKDAPKKTAYGTEFQTLATGDNIMCTIMRDVKGHMVPKHNHPAEQVGYILKGKIKLFINGVEAGTMEPGDSYVIKSNEYHSFEMLEDSEWIDTFSPPREEYKNP